MIGVVDGLEKALVRECIGQALHALSRDRPGARNLRDGARTLLRESPQDPEPSRRLAHPSSPAVCLRAQAEERVRELKQKLFGRRARRTRLPPGARFPQVDNMLSK